MKEPVSKKKLREFGLLIGIGFPILVGWLLPSLFGQEFRAWTLWVGVPGLSLGLTAPRLLNYPYIVWMALGHTLGWVNSHVILGIVFVLVLQPIAFSMRLFGYDPLRRKPLVENTYREYLQDRCTDLTRIF